MKNKSDFEKFKNLSYEDFKNLASDKSLSIYQKIGFPNEYRKGKEEYIYQDIIQKLGFDINPSGKCILDIGPGCSELPLLIMQYCEMNECDILLVDSAEMLEQLPKLNNAQKFEGYFPNDVPVLINNYQKKIDYIVAYSIFHYIFYNTCIFKFIDAALSLLKPGGKLLIGDIPNISKRKRFFSTEAGIKFHQEFTNSKSMPELPDLQNDYAHIDDGVIMGIMQRYRGFGFDTYLLPQNSKLPMNNRREDLLICKI